MNHTKWILPLLAIALLLGTTGCKDEEEINIAGSSTVEPVTNAIIEAFKAENPDIKVTNTSTGTGGGFKEHFIPGRTAINNASRPIKDSEKEAAKENGIEAIELKIGIDALSVVVNPEADWADSMTFEQLARIWGDKNRAKKWSDLDPDWPDEDIQLLGPTNASGTYDYFSETVLEGQKHIPSSEYQGTEHDNVIVNAVKNSKYAMGYFGFAYYVKNEASLKAVAIAEKAGDTPVKPSMDTAQSNEYPLSRPLFIYVSKKELEKPHVKKFVEFYIRKAATDLVSEVGYVPITKEEMEANLKKIGVEP